MVTIAHPSLHRGDRCPGCTTGKIYPLAEPAMLVRITGMAPVLVRDATPQLVPAWDELLRQAAQGEVVYTDDTTMKVLALTAEQRRAAAADEETDARTGVFTSGIVATREGQRMARFFTGRQHAGENLADVLAQRAADHAPPIQMGDALPTNTAGDFETILAGCLAHARRRFVDVVDNFPAEVRYVLETLREVYRTDALARERALSPEERLRVHQTESGPLMAGLETWLRQQLADHLVEPNSGLGAAIAYMLTHWTKLTRPARRWITMSASER